ncbi:maleylpyruvate isomerase N-terminal domain-containing protein [Streptomyces boncukensis]|uniref:Mycothiol-dependent maleylpyruvate isomerase metal-binding domain-containing protein n=1 Tax=Streptomyces boncukensis TaxID=2711219 RepID=A0A6G4X1Z3_9ACTN|nr:maleylpyruvate isomerase N-terminal domain-containing protein [Streptomyces boncukensis]NGO70681.1 hypothetical protein [Streptomyces boncukensis]
MRTDPTIRDEFLTAARTAVALLRAPAVATGWREPSALEGFSVGGLAAHLGKQVLLLRDAAEPVAPGAPITLLEFFARAPWVGQDAAHWTGVMGRELGEAAAADGPEAVAARTAEALEEAPGILADAPADQVVRLSYADCDLTLDDFLLARLLEIVVHADDLAVSVGIPTPDFPEPAAFLVTDLLSRLAIRRHGQVSVLRALSRAERTPETISAL